MITLRNARSQTLNEMHQLFLHQRPFNLTLRPTLRINHLLRQVRRYLNYNSRRNSARKNEIAVREVSLHGLGINCRIHDRDTCETTMGPAIRPIVKRVSDWYDRFFDDIFVSR